MTTHALTLFTLRCSPSTVRRHFYHLLNEHCDTRSLLWRSATETQCQIRHHFSGMWRQSHAVAYVRLVTISDLLVRP